MEHKEPALEVETPVSRSEILQETLAELREVHGITIPMSIMIEDDEEDEEHYTMYTQFNDEFFEPYFLGNMFSHAFSSFVGIIRQVSVWTPEVENSFAEGFAEFMSKQEITMFGDIVKKALRVRLKTVSES